MEPKDLGRLQLLMENRGAGFTISPERLSEGNVGQNTVLTLKCAKMEGNGAPGRSGEGFSMFLLVLIHLILYQAMDKTIAGSRSQSFCAG